MKILMVLTSQASLDYKPPISRLLLNNVVALHS